MSDVYADFLDLLSPAAGGIQAGGWLFGDVLLAGRGALQVACNGLVLEPDGLLEVPGIGETLFGDIADYICVDAQEEDP